MSAPKFTRDTRVATERDGLHDCCVVSSTVGRGYFGSIGSALQRDKNPAHGGEVTHETARANAHLWAAAPAMYEALQELTEASVDYARLVSVERFDRDDIAVQRAYGRLAAATQLACSALSKAGGA